MFIEDCNKLGFVYKAYGIKGELIIRTDIKLSENIIDKWESIFIKINGILVPFFIENIYLRPGTEIQVLLEDIEDEIQAKPYIGTEVYIDKKHFVLETESTIFNQYLSYIIIDSQGTEIGEIIESIEYPGQDLLKIVSPDSDNIMIPAIEEWIESIDLDKKTIKMNLPEGLIDINKMDDYSL